LKPLEVLRAAPLFDGIEAAAVEALARRFEAVSLVEGATLFRPGDASTDLYIVAAGRIRAMIDVDQDIRKTVSHFGPGEHLGEFSFLSGGPRSAAAEADSGPAVVCRITRAAWDGFEREHPAAALRVVRRLALSLIERLRKTNEELAQFVRLGLESMRLQGI
jgi:CRP-like cAMP-binding protein